VEAEENSVVEKSRKHVVINGIGSEYGKAVRDVERKWLDDGKEEQSTTHEWRGRVEGNVKSSYE